LKSWKILILLSVIIVSACKESPNEFGDEFLPPGDRYNFQHTESTSKKDSTYKNEDFYNHISASEALIVGKYGDIKSTTFVRFPLTAPDSIKTMLLNGQITITSSWVQMVATHYYGDEKAEFDFTVHKILNNTDFTKMNSAAFAALTYDPADLSLSSPKVFKDTLTTFNLDTGIVTEWIKAQTADSLTVPKNYGVVIIPTASTKKAVSYLSHDNTVGNPVRIYFEFKNSNKVNKDTLSAFATLDTYYSEYTLPTDTDKSIYLVGGITINNKIKFDLPELPNNAVMNKATLELHIDTTRTVIGNAADTNYTALGSIINVTRVITSNPLKIDSLSVLYVSKQASPNQKTYSGDITEYIQKWINEKNNNGLVLSVSGEVSDVSKLVFYGSTYSDLTLRPRLKITYTLRNKE
jgi:hypothetical protein